MARNKAESESEGSDPLRSALWEFTSNFYKNNPSAQIDTGSIMSGLTDGFERMRGTAKAAVAAKAAAAARSPHRFADVLVATAPDASDIAAIYTHLATATTANCDDIAEGYADDDYPHAYLLAVKPSANIDTPYMLPIFGGWFDG